MEIGQLSHKLINQIAIVSSYASWLQELELPDDQREMVDEIVIASQAAIELFRALDSRIGSLQMATREEQREREVEAR